jgi:hypothetical protein
MNNDGLRQQALIDMGLPRDVGVRGQGIENFQGPKGLTPGSWPKVLERVGNAVDLGGMGIGRKRRLAIADLKEAVLVALVGEVDQVEHDVPGGFELVQRFVNSLPLLEVARVLKPFIFKGSKLAQDL